MATVPGMQLCWVDEIPSIKEHGHMAGLGAGRFRIMSLQPSEIQPTTGKERQSNASPSQGIHQSQIWCTSVGTELMGKGLGDRPNPFPIIVQSPHLYIKSETDEAPERAKRSKFSTIPFPSLSGCSELSFFLIWTYNRRRGRDRCFSTFTGSPTTCYSFRVNVTTRFFTFCQSTIAPFDLREKDKKMIVDFYNWASKAIECSALCQYCQRWKFRR